MSWLLPYLAASLAVLGLAGVIHSLLHPPAWLPFQLGASALCWSLACAIAAVWS